ncbi:hypothetical protein NBEOAGPD_5333 [Methylobacterium gregans]|uniref:Glycosyltransferase RgtA/B/C/D-like domain-containing protein n=2 Tax=Methylobacterium gregans TaxID=374424 RepID=A0AA37HV49_9HYPH|nr:hypothetical protein [Methylobacterium gregans]MDQ0522158.1 Gpi18-like mannosyltransferase [Methylobacterium gregans]GJD82074.1 hypothetical protein NBEOAGPD_5333 [Methylobacterium gregans]
MHDAVIKRPRLRTHHVVAIMVSVAAMIIILYRSVLHVESADAHWWFLPWLRHILDHGVVQTLSINLPVLVPEANNAGNYTPPYLYLLSVGSYASAFADDLTVIKMVSISGAIFCAASLAYLLSGYVRREIALCGAIAYLLLPSVVSNAAAWGQIESFYTGFVLIAVARAGRDDLVSCMIAFGVAVSIKLQAVFIAPFLLYLVISRRASVGVLVIPPVVYALMMVPAWMAGRPARDLAMIYVEQSHAYPWLSMNAPNPWTFVQYFRLIPQPTGMVLGIGAGLVVGLTIAGLGFVRRESGRRDEGPELLLIALASATLIPYVLPKMGDRYFFMADTLSYALAIAHTRRWSVGAALAIQIGSFGAYLTHFTGYRVGTGLGVLAMTVAVIVICSRMLELRHLRQGVRSFGIGGRVGEGRPVVERI